MVHQAHKMKAYSIDLREKIVQAYEHGNTSVRKVATNFGVTKSFVQKLLLMKKKEGHVKPKKQGGAVKGDLDGYDAQLAAMVEQYPDKTFRRILRILGYNLQHLGKYKYYVSCAEKTKFNIKKKTLRSSQARTERVQK
ncbi:MAG: hypothetical protein WBF90_26800 [Rivularia sp. (in: cyanobacteria)]